MGKFQVECVHKLGLWPTSNDFKRCGLVSTRVTSFLLFPFLHLYGFKICATMASAEAVADLFSFFFFYSCQPFSSCSTQKILCAEVTQKEINLIKQTKRCGAEQKARW